MVATIRSTDLLVAATLIQRAYSLRPPHRQRASLEQQGSHKEQHDTDRISNNISSAVILFHITPPPDSPAAALSRTLLRLGPDSSSDECSQPIVIRSEWATNDPGGREIPARKI